MSTLNNAPVHPLSPRRRLPRAVLIIFVLGFLWTVDPGYVDTIATWLGILVVLLPAPRPTVCGHQQLPGVATA